MNFDLESEKSGIHWYEGMFLLPHHHQTADRRLRMAECEKTRTLMPFWWGVAALQLNTTALASFRLKVEKAVICLKDGTWLNIPDNAVAGERLFEENEDQLDSGLDVWFAVRRPEIRRPHVHELEQEHKGQPRTFLLRENKVADENTGENEQSILSRLWNVQIEFGPKPGDEYESIKVGELVWSATKEPMFKSDYIPALINIAASEYLHERAKNLMVRLNNQASFLHAELAAKRIAMTTNPLKVLSNLSRAQISASYGLVLQQMLNVNHTHPYELYLELIRLAGELSALSPDVHLDILPYNHDNLNMVMGSLIKLVEQMIGGGVVVDYIHRRFEVKSDFWRECRLDREWLEPSPGTKVSIYLSVTSEMEDQLVDQMLSDQRVKIAPKSKVEQLLRDRLYGLECKRLRRVPSGLPDQAGLHYFTMDLLRNSELYQDLLRDLLLVIHGISVRYASDISLYVYIDKGER